jgi:hypothetical protein
VSCVRTMCVNYGELCVCKTCEIVRAVCVNYDLVFCIFAT